MSVVKPFVFALVCEELGREERASASASTPPACRSTRVTAVEQSPRRPDEPDGELGRDRHDEPRPRRRRRRAVDASCTTALSRFAGRELALDDEVYALGERDEPPQPGPRAPAAELRPARLRTRRRRSTSTRGSAASTSPRATSRLMGATLATAASTRSPHERVVDAESCHYTLAVMTTAGLYETSGDWLYDIGLPGQERDRRRHRHGRARQGRPRHVRAATRRGRQQRQGAARRAVPLAPARARPLRARSPRREAPAGSRSLLGRACSWCRLAAAARIADERRSPQRYAPVVRLVDAAGGVRAGEPYVPIDVDRAASTSRPWRCAGRGAASDLVTIAPTGAELSTGLYEYHLDFPGNALDPGCGYLHWQERRSRGHDARRLRARRDRGRRSRASSRCSTGSSTSSTTGTTCTRATGRWCSSSSTRRRRRQALQRPAGRDRLQPARGRGARGAGTTTSSSASTARTRSCTPPRDRTPTSSTTALLPRQLGRAGRRLRRHARADVRRPARS